jgi:hypothetical protein
VEVRDVADESNGNAKVAVVVLAVKGRDVVALNGEVVAKSITDIQPRNTKWTGLPFGIVENRFQQKGMFIATFAGSSTLLFV